MKKLYFLVLPFIFLSNLSAQNIIFTDSGDFKDILVYYTSVDSNIAKDKDGNNIKVDSNNDREIQVSEALNVYQLNMDDFDKKEFFFTSGRMNGIEYFTNLTYLNCRSCNAKYLDVTQLKKLEELNCDDNYMESLNVTGLTNLRKLSCQTTIFDTILLTGLTNLEYLDCSNGIKTTLDLSGCPNLKTFVLDGTSLVNLSVSGLNKLEDFLIKGTILTTLVLKNLPSLKILNCGSTVNQTTPYHISKLELEGLGNLEELNCSYNDIAVLDLSSCTKLKSLICSRNKLSGVLDVSDKKYLTLLHCYNNNLTGLIAKNGYEWKSSDIFFYSNPSLKYICVENNQYSSFKSNVELSGMSLSTIEINSYCTFRPGGANYEIKGITKIDSDTNGCDAEDGGYSYLKYNITEGIDTGTLVANASGTFSIPVQEGTFTITPVLENPKYFNISPVNATVVFPTQSSPLVQNFCITPIGTYTDLEITLIPLEAARPGFDVKYKIVYKNKGNTIQSGSVNLNFDDTILDYISSDTDLIKKDINNLSWNFNNLKPTEYKEIAFTLKINKPTDTPAVKNGDILKFIASISSQGKDESPNDSTFTLNQRTVGSFDPNDKTCLEGEVITPNLIGEYVHYMIRFENTGTYSAQNIVVKDMIDLSKFDISTLIPTSSSHSFVTKISDENKVEFIFENIKLPFDDANNDGYIAFKIKTKPTLVTGDSFTNDASIYFDYNFPILTNKATSTFKTLGTQDFEFSNYFALYPNPTSNSLNIATNQSIEIQSLSIYDILGQLVIAVPDAKSISTVDVSRLRTGNYFIKVKSDKGSSSMKFIKN